MKIDLEERNNALKEEFASVTALLNNPALTATVDSLVKKGRITQERAAKGYKDLTKGATEYLDLLLDEYNENKLITKFNVGDKVLLKDIKGEVISISDDWKMVLVEIEEFGRVPIKNTELKLFVENESLPQ